MAMETSILKSIKKILGLADDYAPFDLDVLIFINSAFSSLNELGVGDVVGYTIEEEDVTWESLDLSPMALSLVKVYIFIKVKMLFDPPPTSFMIEAIEKQLAEHAWSLVAFHDETAPVTYPEMKVSP